jgi:hypothetical protein
LEAINLGIEMLGRGVEQDWGVDVEIEFVGVSF